MSAHGSKETWPTHLPDSILKHVTATGLHKDLNNLVESLSSEEWVVSWLHRLQSFRPPQIKPQHISTKDSYDVISTKGWLAKSEEAAIAWKLRGNDAFQKGQLQEALQFYNVMICSALETTTIFTGISNKASCFYKLKDWQKCMTLDQYCMEKEQKPDTARKQRLEARIASCKENLKTAGPHQAPSGKTSQSSNHPQHPNQSQALPFHLPPPSFPSRLSNRSGSGTSSSSITSTTLIHVESLPGFGNSLVATNSIDVATDLFSEPQLPMVELLGEENRSKRCAACFAPLFAAPIRPCKHCTQGFCCENCFQHSSAFHDGMCAIPALLLAPSNAVLGLYASVALTDASDMTNEPKTVSTTSPSSSLPQLNISTSSSDMMRILEGHANDMPIESLTLWAVHAILISGLVRSHKRISTVQLLRCMLICLINAFSVSEVVFTSASLDNQLSPVQHSGHFRFGLALYSLPSFFNHSCAPNTQHHFVHTTNRLVFRSVAPIERGEQLFHCYGPQCPQMDVDRRKQALKNQYHFTCRCHACVTDSVRKSSLETQEISLVDEQSLNASLHEYLHARAAGIASSQLLPQLKNILEEEEEIQARIAATSDTELRCNTEAWLIESFQSIEALVKLRVRKYSLVSQITSGEGFEGQVDAMLPNSYGIQHEHAEWLDKCAYFLTQLTNGTSKDALYLLHKSITILERWYGPHRTEMGHEWAKLGLLIVNYLEATHDVQWLSQAIIAIEKAFEIFMLNFGPDHPRTIEMARMKEGADSTPT